MSQPGQYLIKSLRPRYNIQGKPGQVRGTYRKRVSRPKIEAIAQDLDRTSLSLFGNDFEVVSSLIKRGIIPADDPRLDQLRAVLEPLGAESLDILRPTR